MINVNDKLVQRRFSPPLHKDTPSQTIPFIAWKHTECTMTLSGYTYCTAVCRHYSNLVTPTPAVGLLTKPNNIIEKEKKKQQISAVANVTVHIF